VITVKKNKITEFFKAKGYYVLLFVGVIAIAAVAVIGSRLSDQQKENDNYVDLNEPEPDNNIEDWENKTRLSQNNQVSDEIANTEQAGNSQNEAKTEDKGKAEVVDNDRLLEYDIYSSEKEENSNLVKKAVKMDATKKERVAKEKREVKPAAVETTAETVQADTKKILKGLSFDKEKGLLWPVSGDVIMNYSMDHTIYHATLMLYKCNPAIIIDAEVGTEVKAAAKGIVTSIENNEETGQTVTVNIGDGYCLVYGQLDEDTLEVKVGKQLNEGDIVGTIAEPTKYYSVEGSNLFFEVMENDNTVNPMLLLH
jgi:murein DD-endopeptidase MepM/ murein hydrolase activator NlpD